MRGNFAPVLDEIEAHDLDVVGTLPAELNGRYIRNGANPKHGPTMHWFAGDGMLHGLRVRDGRAEWYRNRWVRTKALAGQERIDMSTGQMDLTVGLANTHVVRHANRIFALEEGSLPNEISPGAGHPRPLRLRRRPRDAVHRAPAHLSRDGRDAPVRLRARTAAVRHVPRRRRRREARPHTTDRCSRADDGARLRDQPELRDLPRSAGGVRPGGGHEGVDAVRLVGDLRRAHRSAAPRSGASGRAAAVVRRRPVLRVPHHERLGHHGRAG